MVQEASASQPVEEKEDEKEEEEEKEEVEEPEADETPAPTKKTPTRGRGRRSVPKAAKVNILLCSLGFRPLRTSVLGSSLSGGDLTETSFSLKTLCATLYVQLETLKLHVHIVQEQSEPVEGEEAMEEDEEPEANETQTPAKAKTPTRGRGGRRSVQAAKVSLEASGSW